MKKWMRMLGILLCMALICGAAGEELTSTEALVGTAEPAAQTEAPSPEDAAPDTSETPVTETSSDPDTEVSAEPTSETSAEPTSEATAEVTAEPTPEPTPEPVVIAPAQEKLTLGIGEKRSVADWHFLSGGSGFDGPVEYVSSNRRVATVDANGVVKALRSGKAVITVRAAAASCTIQLEIKSAPKSVSLKLSRAELGAGESAGFSVALPKGRGGSWTVETSDPAIAAVNGNTIVAVAPGTVKITVRTFNGKTNTQTLTVRPAPESVSFDRDSLT
ncbi:MAG: Ig-like domain-containing protein, partial [Eubacteriales bacterium]|nr:Ig-like domain-containing protein [Eubacteriales bacterium]